MEVYYTSDYLPGKKYCYDCIDMAEAEIRGRDQFGADPGDFIEL